MTREEMREEYLALESDQEKADYIWTHRTSGAKLGIAPSQYPNCEPTHKPCKRCGGRGVVVRKFGTLDPNDVQITCERCGAKTEMTWSALRAWRDWDDGKIVEGTQLTLFDIGRI